MILAQSGGIGCCPASRGPKLALMADIGQPHGAPRKYLKKTLKHCVFLLYY
jgi:hypothetical protein